MWLFYAWVSLLNWTELFIVVQKVPLWIILLNWPVMAIYKKQEFTVEQLQDTMFKFRKLK